MGSVNVKNNTLYLDFRYQGVRCKEYTKLPNSAVNRKRLKKLVQTIDAEILIGTFEYGKYFPNSKLRTKFDSVDERKRQSQAYFNAPDSPRFEEFARIWLTVFDTILNCTISDGKSIVVINVMTFQISFHFLRVYDLNFAPKASANCPQ